MNQTFTIDRGWVLLAVFWWGFAGNVECEMVWRQLRYRELRQSRRRQRPTHTLRRPYDRRPRRRPGSYG